MGLFNKQFEFIKCGGLAALLLSLVSTAAFAADPCIAPGKFKKLEAPSCAANAPRNCNSCKDEIKNQKEKSGKKFDKIAKSCASAASGCSVPSAADGVSPGPSGDSAPSGTTSPHSVPGTLSDPDSAWLYPPLRWRVKWISRFACEQAYAAGNGTQNGSSKGGKDSMSKTAQCESAAAKANRDAAKIADDCATAIKSACSEVPEGETAEKVCKDISAEANQIAAADDAKAAEAQKNADKNDDNAKKEGGGMPQMPQIPQMPQQQQDQPQASNPAVSTGTDASITSATAATPPEAVKLDSGGTGSSAVGFGASTSTNTSTTTSAGYPSYSSPGSSPAASGQYGSSSPLGSTGGSSGGGSYSPGGGGSSGGTGGGGALQNTTGASAPGGGEKAAGDSPYEVSGGGGGKLGAPKGFKSGEGGDGAIADIAKDTFKADIGAVDASGGAGDAKTSDDESESGFSVFKMVKARYVELKKRGSI
jgi:hypothetical protein